VTNVEANVDDLLSKLESQGKKVKILNEDDEAKEEEEKTRMQQKMQELM
jgi:translation elongation factor EF-Tu-like GTPase